MVGEVVRTSVHNGLVVRTTLDPKEQPFLDDHRGDRVTALLPGVMGIEGMVETARLLAADWALAAVEDVDFHAPLKFYRDEPRTLEVVALVHPDGADLVAECRIEAERQLPGSDTPTRTTHFTGRVRLSRTGPEPARVDPPARAGDEAGAEDVYRMYFHGPAYQVVSTSWRVGDAAAAELAGDLPANHAPADQPTQAAPRLVEALLPGRRSLGGRARGPPGPADPRGPGRDPRRGGRHLHRTRVRRRPPEHGRIRLRRDRCRGRGAGVAGGLPDGGTARTSRRTSRPPCAR